MLDVAVIRSRFPALGRTVGGRPAAYLDGPGGTQAPLAVIDAMAGYLERGGSNLGGSFAASAESGAVIAAARAAMVDLLGARRPSEIVFGQNMTSLTFAVSRALARTWEPGDEIVVTRLDHDANVTPWVLAARDVGAVVRWWDFDPETGCLLDLAGLEPLLGPRTRLVAVTHASNALGSVVPVADVAAAAHAAGAMVYVDAVHFAPHGLLDVMGTGCDFLVCSAYKFFGPHTGVLYGRKDRLAALEAYKVRPAPSDPPGKWETGTQSFESLAGVTAAVDYLASLGTGPTRRARLEAAMAAITDYEAGLSARFLAGAARIPGVAVYGPDDPARRTPTFAVSVEGWEPAAVAARLGEAGVFVWAGHYYAVEVMQRLGVLASGGLVRIGFVHYNTAEEVDRVLAELGEMAAAGPP